VLSTAYERERGCRPFGRDRVARAIYVQVREIVFGHWWLGSHEVTLVFRD